MTDRSSPSKRLHYAWVVAGLTFLILLATAGIRATPSILIVPLEREFGWSRSLISTAVAINIALFGLIGPFAASFMARFSLRRTVMAALALLSLAALLSAGMRSSWHMLLLWGVLIGIGTGATSLVLAAVVVNRWFEQRKGLVLGFLTAANATGQLIFLPLLATLVERSDWRTAVMVVGGVAAAVLIVVALWMRNDPAEIGLQPFGQTTEAPVSAVVVRSPLRTLAWVSRSRDFWILAGSFFICGASTNGLVGTHLIPACMDHGIPEVQAAGLLAVMGIFDLLGTTGSGWLTDRFDSRKLLFCYYGLRGLALLYLPFSLESADHGLSIFAVFYGLDWIATVPPTVRLTADAFGKENVGVVYGWIGAAHQLGASLAALGAGITRTQLGDYRNAFWAAGLLCLAAALLVNFGHRWRARPSAATLPS
ncbi:MAG TPA: MFS transporter [Blastocatellia bacterium]|nr:MFS transporter [Blastocatellia bacterium]